ncbi:MAG: SMP-30/gluconolactonase/LRE family protein, partial [Phycisphaeraceae bacterium]
KLYWTDIPTGRLFRYDPASDQAEQIYEGRPVGGFTFQEDGALLLFRDHGNVVVWRDGKEVRTIIDEIPDERGTRFNDVFADPEGRVFCGTMPLPEQRAGRLYRLDPDGSCHLLLENIACSNGMDLTPDGTQFYYTDSGARTIYLFDYDRATGNLTNQRPFLEVPEDAGLPDGMTVDATGDIWNARFNGGCVCHITADGSLAEKIDLPAKQITSLIFAGDDYTDLYITSAGAQNKPDTGAHAGALFHFRPGVQGKPEHASRIGL